MYKSLLLRQDGSIKRLVLRDTDIFFRNDNYRGIALTEHINGLERNIRFEKVSDFCFVSDEGEIDYKLEYSLKDFLTVKVTVFNNSGCDINIDRLCLCLGIDSYMTGYPQWNDRMFPTMFRCEKTHFVGYMQSPVGKAVVLASPDPIASWSCCYNNAVYGDELHPGHRIYTANLELLNSHKFADRFPNKKTVIKSGNKLVFRIYIDIAQNEELALKRAYELIDAPYIESEKYTYEKGEKLTLNSNGKIVIKDHSENSFSISDRLNQGYYTVFSEFNGLRAESKIYVRDNYSKYLLLARESLLKYPPKATTHAESWYGFFSAFLARKYFPDEKIDVELENKFKKVLNLLYSEEGMPYEQADPKRIQNSSSMVSILVDAYEASGNDYYLSMAERIVDNVLLKAQHSDGAFYAGDADYTCVIYPAKSILELCAVAKKIGGEHLKKAEQYFLSVKSSMENLFRLEDDIHTEGEHTFEDGMITCGALQLGLYALTLSDRQTQAAYTKKAEKLLKKHKCLELCMVPDCRMRGATLRFWESLYDVAIMGNMFNSPHGWTAWKIYATYYLYLLTNKLEYLKDTMDTLGSCIQLLDIKNGNLRWSFVADGYVKADALCPRSPKNIFGEKTHSVKLRPQIYSEEYIGMISDWFTAPEDHAVNGFPLPHLACVDGMYSGGTCENDVHEVFKAMEEVALHNCFFHFEKGNLFAYNCKVIDNGDFYSIFPSESMVDCCIAFSDKPCRLNICFEGNEKNENIISGELRIIER